jgi:amidophosphoribosyltransferase
MQLSDDLGKMGLSKNMSLGDSEVILEIILSKMPSSCPIEPSDSVPRWIVSGLREVYKHCVGSFACVLSIPSYGLVAFRDANGIKPIVFGERRSVQGDVDYMFASESVAFRSLGYSLLRDVRPGRSIGQQHTSQTKLADL